MSFVSTEFIIFALLVIPIFFMLGQKRRWLLLLVASYCFYAYWMPSYLLLILFSTLVDYLVALALQSTAAERVLRRRILLVAVFWRTSACCSFSSTPISSAKLRSRWRRR